MFKADNRQVGCHFGPMTNFSVPSFFVQWRHAKALGFERQIEMLGREWYESD